VVGTTRQYCPLMRTPGKRKGRVSKVVWKRKGQWGRKKKTGWTTWVLETLKIIRAIWEVGRKESKKHLGLWVDKSEPLKRESVLGGGESAESALAKTR